MRGWAETSNLRIRNDMSEQTEIIEKPQAKEPGTSTAFNVSVRAWLALIITLCVCANWTANMVMASLGYTSVNIVIPEPIYSAFMMVLGMYFGQAVKKQ